MAQMPSNSNDPYLHNARKTFAGTMKLFAYGAAATAVILLLMAAFLV